MFLAIQINIATDIRLTEIHGPGVDKEPLNLFKIDNKTAKIWVMQPVDREKHDHFKVISKKHTFEQCTVQSLTVHICVL